MKKTLALTCALVLINFRRCYCVCIFLDRRESSCSYVGIGKPSQLEDQKMAQSLNMYKDVRDVYLAIYSYVLWRWHWIRFGIRSPWTVPMESYHLAGNAGSYTADSSGQMTVENGSKAILTRSSKTRNYSHIRYEPFNPLTGTGSISKNKSSWN